MALVAFDVSWCIEVVVVAWRDVVVGQQVGDIETDDLSGVVVCCSSFDTLREPWDETEVSSARKSHDAVKCPDCNAAPEEAVEFSFEDFEVAVKCQWLSRSASMVCH
jgi:hypothetical protein